MPKSKIEDDLIIDVSGDEYTPREIARRAIHFALADALSNDLELYPNITDEQKACVEKIYTMYESRISKAISR